MKNNLLVLVGALIGGIVGGLLSYWIYRQGYYAMVLPGGLAGLGAGIFRTRALPIHIACGLLALLAGLITEWSLFPFLADGSLPYFLTHLTALRPITHLMLSAGTFIGFWIPFRRGRAK